MRYCNCTDPVSWSSFQGHKENQNSTHSGGMSFLGVYCRIQGSFTGSIRPTIHLGLKVLGFRVPLRVWIRVLWGLLRVSV